MNEGVSSRVFKTGFIIPSYTLRYENIDIQNLKAVVGKWAEFRTSRGLTTAGRTMLKV